MTVDFDFNLHFATCCQVVVSFLRARSVSFYISSTMTKEHERFGVDWKRPGTTQKIPDSLM